MGEIVAFPTPKPAPPLTDICIAQRRAQTASLIRSQIIIAVHDALIGHGADTAKPDIIAAAFTMALRDISKKAACPEIVEAIVEELASGKTQQG